MGNGNHNGAQNNVSATKWNLGIVISLIAIISAVLGSIFFLDNRYASNVAFSIHSLEFKKKVATEKLDQKQDEIWDLENRIVEDPENEEDQNRNDEFKNSLKELKYEKTKIKEHYDTISRLLSEAKK